MVYSPSVGSPFRLRNEEGDHQGLEHRPIPARDDPETSVGPIPFIDRDTLIDPDLASTGRHSVVAIGRTSPRHPEVMLGRKLALGDPDVAGNPRFGVEHPVMERGKRAIVGIEATTEEAGVEAGVGGIVRIVEESEVHRTEKVVGRDPELRPGVPDHHQRRGEPAVIDRRKEGPDRATTGPGLERRAVRGVVPVIEESVRAFELLDGGQGPADPGRGLWSIDDLQVFRRQDAPEVGGDIRGRRIV